MMQQPRHVMIVIANAELLLDEVADHRAGPNTRLIARGNGTEFNDRGQRPKLFVRQFVRGAFGDARAKPLDVIRVVPLDPSIHRTTSDFEFGRDVLHAATIDIRANGTTSSPFAEVIFEACFDDECI